MQPSNLPTKRPYSAITADMKDGEIVKLVVMFRLGFPIDHIAARFNLTDSEVLVVLSDHKFPEEFLKTASTKIIESIANELSFGFKEELQAVHEAYYFTINKLRLKIISSPDMSLKDLRNTALTLFKIKEGNPFDTQINLLFQSIKDKKEIIQMANATVEPRKPGPGSEEIPSPEAH